MDKDTVLLDRPSHAPAAADLRLRPHEFCDLHGRRLLLSDAEDLWREVTRERPEGKRPRLGELLMANGALTAEQLERALKQQRQERLDKNPHRPIGQILLQHESVTPLELQVALTGIAKVPLVDAKAIRPQRDALAMLEVHAAMRLSAMPVLLRRGQLVVAVNDPWDASLLDELRFLTNQHIVAVAAMPGTLEAGIIAAYDRLQREAEGGDGHNIEVLAQALARDLTVETTTDSNEAITESSNTLVRLVHQMIEDAIQRRASDIHIEYAPQQGITHVRFRVDGSMVTYLDLPQRYLQAMTARIKIMSNLDISEHRRPQDGKIDFSRFGGSPTELRVVTIPTNHGHENIVLRLLAGTRPMPLESLALSPRNLDALRQTYAKPFGLILICGPTGCGKTTTLHSALHELNDGERKIWTAEDPIEITQDGLCQVQVNPRIGWTFAAAMRTFLRADPDVIMIGEMRDQETAEIAIEASLTGHLVFSTLHTNSAAESVTRLLEIGLDPYNFSDSLLAVLAQRLVRRLCPQCSTPQLATATEIECMLFEHHQSTHGLMAAASDDELLQSWRSRFGDEQGRLRLRRKNGCDHCEGRGYKGRLGLHELLVSDDTIREQIRHRAPASDILQSGLRGGMRTLRQDGIEKVLQGLTDMREVIAASNL